MGNEFDAAVPVGSINRSAVANSFSRSVLAFGKPSGNMIRSRLMVGMPMRKGADRRSRPLTRGASLCR